MKVKVVSEMSEAAIGDSGLAGKALVTDEDEVGYSCFDVTIKQNTQLSIKSAFGDKFNHIYYCIYGEVSFKFSDGKEEILKNDHVIALPGTMTANIFTNSKTRLFVTYVKEIEEGPRPVKALHRSLDGLVRTERDIDWSHGRSRRFLLAADNFGVTVTNTLVEAEKLSPLCYMNHKETAYYVEGHLEYIWDDGNSRHEFHQVDRRGDDGACFTMDQNDAHSINAKSIDSIGLCVFYPALKGTEAHDFSKKVELSSY